MDHQFFNVKTNYNCLDLLIGKTVIKLLLNPEKNSFAFILDNGRLEQFNCEGECCSTSWIEHVSGINNLLGKEIKKIVYIALDLSRNENECGKKETLICRWDIYTDFGICTMEMRNFSNNYYSGEIRHAESSDKEFEVPSISCDKDF